jgi:DNA (cytosine-5)-methyltransferase 1
VWSADVVISGVGEGKAPMSAKNKPIKGIDLFCGVGGLSHGLAKAGISIVAGVDLDDQCRFPFEMNNAGDFYLEDVESLTAKQVRKWLGGRGATSLLAGCAPCQPFSQYSRTKSKDWRLLDSFTRLVRECRPDLVTMENVLGIAKTAVYQRFVYELRALKYHVTELRNLDCLKYGIPQSRKRLVVIASRLGSVTLIEPTHSEKTYRTVRQTIGRLRPIVAGGQSRLDRLHASARLSKRNLQRIKASKAGGTWRDWPKSLVTKCHSKETGTSYPGVYGRMEYNKPSPTITTQAHGYGSGRFGHPTQHRAISLREAAMLQTFPQRYKFLDPEETINFSKLGRLIGNAVPVKLGEIIGRSLLEHVAATQKTNRRGTLNGKKR